MPYPRKSARQHLTEGTYRADRHAGWLEEEEPTESIEELISGGRTMRAPCNVADYDPHRDAKGFYFDGREATRRVRFFEQVLTHVTGGMMRQPLKLEKMQRDWVATLFGWKEKRTGLRRYRRAFFLLGRKNSKSTMAAGCSLSCLHLDGEGGAQCFCAAGDKKQAGIVYEIAARMTQQKPALDKISKVRATNKKIIVDESNSFLWAVPANEDTLFGFEPHVIVCDEVHVWKDRRVYDALHTGTASRIQPLEIVITTAAEEGESPLYDDFYSQAVDVRDGLETDPRFLPVIYEASLRDDWTDERIWKKANPLYGISVRKEYMQEECERAKKSPATAVSFKKLHLNMPVSSIVRWVNEEHWQACRGTDRPIDGDNVVGGLDLSSTSDLTSWCMYDPEAARMRWRYWLPADIAGELEREARVPFARWVAEGWLELTPGRTIDQAAIVEAVAEDVREYGLRLIGFDPWQAKWIHQELDRLFGDGFTFEAHQGIAKINEPTQEFGRLVRAHELDHGGNPITTWCAEYGS